MSSPVRMCVVCRGRFPQESLLRLQYQNSKLQVFQGSGRSFYVCRNCQEAPKLSDHITRICKLDKKHKEIIKTALKEIFLYG
ncbi:DUF448 domain-containing protein [Helicobacter winghamensis]|uniref:YlxR domain-containing protein n=1 Tax=Helicobacter winghamensis TaxID=157268 RepID=A0A2N3PLP4_9HELI|nr:DUF448 domain-containing protein [Helicobacter winghamensis]PKT75253.1 hypothetical protein BCM32_06815 [Helicobacter winghamensis]PKT82749.1 hypothetical protein BCM31_06240 [Helicobacter winghamensis]PKT82884.1 hypothetical protein BCM33_05715 [Helicobacter winghamensis]